MSAPKVQTITVHMTRREFRLVMQSISERGSKVHPCDRDPDTWHSLTDKLLDAATPAAPTCSATDHLHASCERQPGFPEPPPAEAES